MSSREGLCFPCYKCCLKNSAKEEETEREEDRECLLDRPENTSVEIPAGSAEGNVMPEGIERVDSSHVSNLTVNNYGSITGNELQPGDETDKLNDCGPANIHEMNEILKKKIRYIFREYITSANILYVFHKYNVAVLNESDIYDVKYKMKRHGPIEGAHLLLDRLVVYKGWFHCLIQVLKDPKVRLLPAAEQLEKIQDELCIKYPQCIKLTEDFTAGETSITADNPKKVKGQNRNTRYIPSQVNIFQEIIAEARQDNKILMEEIIRLNDIKAELHQSLKSKGIQVEKIANRNEELILQLQMSREETQTLMQKIAQIEMQNAKFQDELDKASQDALKIADELKRVNIMKEHLEQDLKNCKDELDQVCYSCKQEREQRKVDASEGRAANLLNEETSGPKSMLGGLSRTLVDSWALTAPIPMMGSWDDTIPSGRSEKPPLVGSQVYSVPIGLLLNAAETKSVSVHNQEVIERVTEPEDSIERVTEPADSLKWNKTQQSKESK